MHINRYFEKRFKTDYKSAKFYFLCNYWVTNKQKWEHHCQKYINDGNIPFRYNPVIFRYVYIYIGYYSIYLGRTNILANERIKTYINLKIWRLYILKYVNNYITIGFYFNNFKYPYPNCFIPMDLGENLWYYFQNIHNVENTLPKKRIFNSEKNNHGRFGSIRFTKK